MTLRICFLFWLTFLAAVSPIFGYNVLMYCPLPSKSHHILCKGVVDTLVDRGHEVSFISAYKTDKAKFNDFGIPELQDIKDDYMAPSFEYNNKSVFDVGKMMTTVQLLIAEKVFSDNKVKGLLSDKSQKFDVVIFEHFMNEMIIGFGVKYDCPVIALSPISILQSLAVLTNNPISIATVPNALTAFSSKMNIWERTLNFLIAVVQDIIEILFTGPMQASLYDQYFPEESKKVPYNELLTKISGVLVNSHPSFSVARPFLPNTVEIGGYFIKDPEPLPEDLKKILDGAKNGVIYFSMGSNLKSKDMSPQLKMLLLTIFAGLKETVLWKYEEDLPDAPKNLIVRKWMPQTGILAHPNLKLFISHGGMLSSTEAAHFGVPLLAIPIFGDQFMNAKSVQEKGYGIYLAFKNITKQSFEWALNEALGNPKYREAAKEIQRLYHDRPLKPRDLLAFHVEHIIRSKGAKHLAPAPLSRCSHMLIDVIGLIYIPIFIIPMLVSWVTWKCCCKRKKCVKKQDKKQKQN